MNYSISNMKLKEFLNLKWPMIEHYLISSLITFITGFLGVFILFIDKINLNSLRTGTWLVFVGVAARAGIKALIEVGYQNLKNKTN